MTAETTTYPDLVGTKFVLWRREYRNIATTKPRNGSESGYVVLEEVPVTVTKQRNDVPGMFGSEGRYLGLKAVSADGRKFSRNWESFPDDAMTGATFRWHHTNAAKDAAYADFVDGVQASSVFHRLIGGQHYDELGEIRVPADALICPRHGDTHLLGQDCESCAHDRILQSMNLTVTYIGCPFCTAVREHGENGDTYRATHIRWDHPDEHLAWSAIKRDLSDWLSPLEN